MIMEKIEFQYKNSYTGIFSLNYFIQGLNTSMFVTVVPIYILSTFGTINQAAIAFMLSILLIPATIKLLYGILTDKFAFKKFGRRKPWIIFSSSFSGIIWFIIPFIMPSTSAGAITLFTISGFFISIGMFMSDTATDGFILDSCPKEKLGRVQGFCWGLRAIGIIAGGPAILLILVYLPIELLFTTLGILMIIFSLFTLLIPIAQHDKEIAIIPNLKLIFKRAENWKVFSFSFFSSIGGGVVAAFVALYILIQAGFLSPEGASLSSLDDTSLYEPQAFISFLISLGIFAGAIIGGLVADKKSRRTALFLSVGLTATSLVLLLLPVSVPILLFFAFFVGFASGWGFASFTAIAAEYSQQYPDFNSSYYSICVSFVNFGTVIGFIFTGIMFSTVSRTITDIRIIYGIIFVSMAISYILILIPFLLMDRQQYEFNLTDSHST